MATSHLGSEAYGLLTLLSSIPILLAAIQKLYNHNWTYNIVCSPTMDPVNKSWDKVLSSSFFVL